MNDFLFDLWAHLFTNVLGNDQVPQAALYVFYLWVYGIVPIFTHDYYTLVMYWTGN